jgi:hypothetical protein
MTTIPHAGPAPGPVVPRYAAPPPAPSGAAPAGRPGPSTAGYWVAGVLAVLTPVAAVAAMLLGFFAAYQRTDGLTRGPVPGTTSVTVAEPRTLVIYVESAVPTAGASAQVSVTGPGGAVEVGPYNGELSYELGDREGTALAVFRADAPGRYTVRSVGGAGGTSSVAVGGDLAPLIAVTVLGPFVIGAAGLGAALVTAVLTHVRRRSSAAREAGYPRRFHDVRFGPR